MEPPLDGWTAARITRIPLPHLLPLLQPEAHAHFAVHRRRSSEKLMRLLALAGAPVELGEAKMAVRLERAHAELLGEGRALAVLGGGLVDLAAIAMRRELAEETVRMRLVAAPRVGARDLEETAGKRARLVNATDEEQSLDQLGEHEPQIEDAASGGDALQHLVQEREGIRSTPGQGIRRAQDRSDRR